MATQGSTANRAIMGVPSIGINEARSCAIEAQRLARSFMPRVTSASATEVRPIWGEEWFGLAWTHPHIWYQEAGIAPFTMRSLAGKTIPMWVNDPDGSTAAKNPRAETRVTDDGRKQVRIFRRAAEQGTRKTVPRMVGGMLTNVSVPASYPGAPGRIAVNRSQGIIRAGDVSPRVANPGWIAPGNVGVRWRHPGLRPSRHIARAVTLAAVHHSLPVDGVKYLDMWNGQVGPLITVVYEG